MELPSLAQGNLISFDPEEELRNKVMYFYIISCEANILSTVTLNVYSVNLIISRDDFDDDSQDSVASISPGNPCAERVQDSLSQGIQTSPVMEASPVQHIQDVYGSPSCGEDLQQHRVEEKVIFWEKEDNVRQSFPSILGVHSLQIVLGIVLM